MKKTKSILSLLAIVLLTCTVTLTVFAQNVPIVDTSSIEKQKLEQISTSTTLSSSSKSTDTNLVATPYVLLMTCTNCGEFAPNVCYQQAIYYDEGPCYILDIIPTSCTVKYVVSGGAAKCLHCGTIVEEYGQHLCWELHSSCSKGHYDVCPMDVHAN